MQLLIHPYFYFMVRYINLIGQKFNRLTVIEFGGVDNNKVKWICKCECGTIRKIAAHSLKSGATKSCGCISNEQMKSRFKSHGFSGGKSPEYKAWISMKSRCYSPKDDSYKHYGGRGITVCKEWINDFPAFLSHIGKRPSDKHSLDRIKTNKNYEPNNIRWATIETQNNNKRSNVNIGYNGTTYTLSNLSRLKNIPISVLSDKIKNGLTIQEIVAHYDYKKENNITFLAWPKVSR